MHYHLELILPPDVAEDEIEAAVADVLAPYDENKRDDEDGSCLRHAFWDWWVIGGRYTGSHRRSHLDPETLDKFYDALRDAEVKVKGVQFGKEDLATDEDREKVAQLWREFFPDDKNGCPDFKDFDGNDRDYRRLGEVGPHLTAFHVIVATRREWADGKPVADVSRVTRVWDGISLQTTTFDGNVASLVAELREKGEYGSGMDIPTDSWIVTVDYHS